MPHQHCTRQLCLPKGLIKSLKRRLATPLAYFLKPSVKHSNKNRNCATELRQQVRNSMVVLKPVCTPVPPVKSGSAAGVAGLAPPASALPEKVTHRLAASGTILPDRLEYIASENSLISLDIARLEQVTVQPSPVLKIFGKLVRLSRPRAADGLDFRALVQQSGFDCRLTPESSSAQKCAMRGRSPVSRPGIG